LKKKNANKSSKKYFWKTSVRVSKNAEFYADSKKLKNLLKIYLKNVIKKV
jgi:hypothetical protein